MNVMHANYTDMFTEDCTQASACWRQAVGWLLLALAIRAVLSAVTPLFPDETYYWEWSRRLAAGYFDHPPAVAWMIATGTAVLGDTTAGVRLLPLLLASVTQLAIVSIAAGLGGATAAMRAAMFSTLLPIATLGLVLATPDVPLFAFVTLALWSADRALSKPAASSQALVWWIVMGIFTGASFLSKYTAVLLPAAMFVAFLLHPLLRRRFREPGPWIAALIAIAFFVPVVLWNQQHDYISFRFQLGHGLGSGAKGSILSREAELIGGQLALATPVLAVLLAIAVWRQLRVPRVSSLTPPRDTAPFDVERTENVNARKFLLAVVSAVPLVFFAISATRRSVEANWPALIYPGAIALLAATGGAAYFGRWWRYAAWTAGFFLVVLSAQVIYPVLPVAPRKDPVARAYGWDRLAAVADSVAAVSRNEYSSTVNAGVGAEANATVTDNSSASRGTASSEANPGTSYPVIATHFASERYQDASELAFHLTSQPVVLALNIASRPNQYDLWYSTDSVIRAGDNLVVSFDDNPAGDERARTVSRWFAQAIDGQRVILARGTGEVAHRKVWLFINALPPEQRHTVSPDSGGTP